MIDGKAYTKLVKEYYSFLITDFNLDIIDEKIRGNAFYDVQYGDKSIVVSINYENIEGDFQVVVYLLENGQLPDYDDKSKTLHLSQLNLSIIKHATTSEIEMNNRYFEQFTISNDFQRKLIKSAKELRLSMN